MIRKRTKLLSLLLAVWMTLSLCTDTASAFLWFGGRAEAAAEQPDAQTTEQPDRQTPETASPSPEPADGQEDDPFAGDQVRTLSTSDDANTCQVTVSIAPDSTIPENAELVVSEIQQEEDHVAQSTDALGETADNVVFAKTLDISLVDPDTGEVYQPDQDVKVSIQLLDAEVSEDTSMEVVSLDSAAENAERLDTATEGDVVAFVTGELAAAYTVVVTTRTQTLETTDGKVYNVTVTYDSASGIPEDAEVLVSEIRAGGRQYREYVSQSAEALGKTEDEVLFARAFDITLKNPPPGRSTSRTRT